MFYQDDELQFPVEVGEPNPLFAKMLQQAIGGLEGEMRVAMQYFFQAAAVPDEYPQYREALRDTAAEELGHIEMLATAVRKNLEGAPTSFSDVENGQEYAALVALTGIAYAVRRKQRSDRTGSSEFGSDRLQESHHGESESRSTIDGTDEPESSPGSDER